MADETRHLQTRFSAVGVQQVTGAAREMARGFDHVAASTGRMRGAMMGMNAATTGPLRSIQESVGRVGTTIGGLPLAIGRVAGPIGAAVSTIGQVVTAGFSAISKTVGSVLSGIASLAQSAFHKIKRYALVGGAALIGLGTMALRTAADFETLRTRVDALFGAGGQAAWTWVEDFAKRTPFQLRDVIDSMSSLQAVGMDAFKWLPALGDVAAKLGGGPDLVNRMAQALGVMQMQAQATGKISMRQVMQLVQAGVPAFEMLSKSLGVSVNDLQRLGDMGLDAKTVMDALQRSMTEFGAGAMAKQMDTLAGKWSNFRDAMDRALNAIGSTLAPVAMAQLDKMIAFLENPRNIAAATRMAQRIAQAFEQGVRRAIQTLQRIVQWFQNPSNMDTVRRWVARVIAAFGLMGEVVRDIVTRIFTGWRNIKMPAWMHQMLGGFQMLTAGAMSFFSFMGTQWGMLGVAIEAAGRQMAAFFQLMRTGNVGNFFRSMGESYQIARDRTAGIVRGNLRSGEAIRDLTGRAQANFDAARNAPTMQQLMDQVGLTGVFDNLAGRFNEREARAMAGLSGFSSLTDVLAALPGLMPTAPGTNAAPNTRTAITDAVANIIGGRQLARQGISRTELPGMTGRGPRGEARIRIETDDQSPISQAMANVSDQSIQQYHNWLFNTPEGRATARAALA